MRSSNYDRQKGGLVTSSHTMKPLLRMIEGLFALYDKELHVYVNI